MDLLEKSRSAALKKCGAAVKKDSASFGAFGSGGRIKETVYPCDGLSLARVIGLLKDEKSVVLGGATNVLFPDGDYDGTVIATSKAEDVMRRGDKIYCSAGARLPDVVKKCAGYALSGMEQLSGIPGTVGGAITMNAGAFGREIAELVTRVDAVTRDGRVVSFNADALGAGYRHTQISAKGLTVLGAEFSLVPSSSKEVKTCIDGFALRRSESQPKGRSLGSVFKRADGISAGYYIERAGLKGKRIGGAEISQKHAGFIINTGEATSADFVYLSELAKKAVYDKFGIELEYEVVFL